MLLEAEDGLHVVAEAGDVPTAMRMIRAHRPRVAVLDLSMPGGSVLEAIPQLRESTPETAIVVLTMQADPAFARHALQNGALGFVLRRPQTTSCWRPSASPHRARGISTPAWEPASPPSRLNRPDRRTTSPSASSTSCA